MHIFVSVPFPPFFHIFDFFDSLFPIRPNVYRLILQSIFVLCPVRIVMENRFKFQYPNDFLRNLHDDELIVNEYTRDILDENGQFEIMAKRSAKSLVVNSAKKRRTSSPSTKKKLTISAPLFFDHQEHDSVSASNVVSKVRDAQTQFPDRTFPTARTELGPCVQQQSSSVDATGSDSDLFESLIRSTKKTVTKKVTTANKQSKESLKNVFEDDAPSDLNDEVFKTLIEKSGERPMGHNSFKLSCDRIDKACISSEYDPFLPFETNKVWSFASHKEFVDGLVDPNDATVFAYLRWCASRAIEAEVDPLYPPNSVLRLFSLFEKVNELGEQIEFESGSHTYSMSGKQMRRSVTKALDLVFGSFDADVVSRSMVKSRRWKNSAYYHDLNFDETGKQRDEETIVKMLKQRWEEKRNQGTVLHEYIHSLSSNTLRSGVDDAKLDEDSPAATTTVTMMPDGTQEEFQAVPEETTVERESDGLTTTFEVTDDKSTDEVQASVESSSVSDEHLSDSYAALYHRMASAALECTLLERWRKFVFNNCFYGTRFVPFRYSTATNDTVAMVDCHHVTAFDRFNRRRLADGWLLLVSEYSVYDCDASLAGSIDAVYVVYPAHGPCLLAIVDWKRCAIEMVSGMRHTNNYTSHLPKCNYSKYAMQVNLYRELLERMLKGYAIVVFMYLVSIREGRDLPEIYSVPRLNDAQLFIDELCSRKY